MPNIGAVLKAEIARLSRKEVRAQMGPAKTASAQYRRHIAELRRKVAELARDVASLHKAAAARSRSAGTPKSARFSAKGLRSHRSRLGLSAEDYGRLAGVSGQSIYNWEREATTPRDAQKARLLSLRALGVRDARAQLARLDESKG